MGLTTAAPAFADTPAASCSRLLEAVDAGSFPTAGGLEPADCGPDSIPAFRYDAPTGGLRALRPLKTGEIVGSVPAWGVAAVRPGQRLYVRAKVGPVLIEREVRALQPARTGERLFVEAADGAVFSISLAEVSR